MNQKGVILREVGKLGIKIELSIWRFLALVSTLEVDFNKEPESWTHSKFLRLWIERWVELR